MRKIITIGREFGSGGREVGKRVAEILQIPYYDNEIVAELAERTQLAVEYVNQFSEGGSKSIYYFPITIGRSFHEPMYQNQMQNLSLHLEQSKLLKELAENTDCVIVGRCANYVLSDFNPLKIFIYAEMESKIKRCRENAPEHEHMSDKELRRHILDIDKNRAHYYKFVTGRSWDEKANYDLMINTTNYPIKAVAQIISELYKTYEGNAIG